MNNCKLHKQLLSRLYPRPEGRGFTLGTDKATYLIVVENLKGSDTLFHFGEMLCKIYDKPWFNEDVIYKTLNGFSTIYKNHGQLRGDVIGGAIYTTHPIKDALISLKDKSLSLNILFNSDAGNKYFSDITSEKQIDLFEKNLSTIMNDYEPCYMQVLLEKNLSVKLENNKTKKI